VAKAYEISERSEILSWTHHQAIAAPGRTAWTGWKKRRKGGWSTRELTRLVVAPGEIVHPDGHFLLRRANYPKRLDAPPAGAENRFRLLGRIAPKERSAEGTNHAARKLLFYVVVNGPIQANYP